jgi:hypothetical protein
LCVAVRRGVLPLPTARTQPLFPPGGRAPLKSQKRRMGEPHPRGNPAQAGGRTRGVSPPLCWRSGSEPLFLSAPPPRGGRRGCGLGFFSGGVGAASRCALVNSGKGSVWGPCGPEARSFFFAQPPSPRRGGRGRLAVHGVWGASPVKRAACFTRFELSLQSAFHQSLALLVLYRSHADIEPSQPQHWALALLTPSNATDHWGVGSGGGGGTVTPAPLRHRVFFLPAVPSLASGRRG